MYKNTQRIGKSIWSRAMAFATISILFSQCNAQSNFNSLQGAPISSFITGEIGDHKISTNDPVFDDQIQYLDWMELAQMAFKGLSEDQISDLMAAVPEFEQLNEPSPFSLNHVVGLTDNLTGDDINEENIKSLMKMGEMMIKQFQGKFGETDSNQSRSAIRKQNHGKHHRNLESLEGEFQGGKYEEALYKLKPILQNLLKARENISAQIKSYQAETESSFSRDNFMEVEKLNKKAADKLHEGYKFVKGSMKVLFIKLKSIEADAEKHYLTKYQMEDKSMVAFDVFVEGLSKSEKYLQESANLLSESTKKLKKVKAYLEDKKNAATNNAKGKGSEFSQYIKTQRAIIYGSCAGMCGVISIGGSPCVACYGVAAAIYETKIAEFKDKNKKLASKYTSMSQEIEEISQPNMLNDLVDEVGNIVELIEDAQTLYDGFLTEGAGQKDSAFSYVLSIIGEAMDQ